MSGWKWIDGVGARFVDDEGRVVSDAVLADDDDEGGVPTEEGIPCSSVLRIDDTPSAWFY